MTTYNLLLLHELAILGAHIEIVCTRWCCHAAVTEAQHLRVEVGIGANACSVSGILKLYVVFRFVVPANDAQLRETVFALIHYQVVFENLDAFEQHIGAMCNHLLPVFFTGGGFRATHETKVFRVEVGRDVETIAVMIDAVFEIPLARLNNLELSRRCIGTAYAVFVAECLGGANHHVFFAFRFVNETRKLLVFFFKHDHIAVL